MWQSDGAGSTARIGVLTPHLDPVPESEFYTMAPVGVSIHTARVPLGIVGPDGQISAQVGPDDVRAFAEPPAVDEAAVSLIPLKLNALIYAFTSSSYIMESEADALLKSRLEDRTGGVSVVIQTPSLITALRVFGSERIALIHPPWFSPELDALGAAYFRQQGVDVVHHGPAKLRSDYGDIRPEQVYEWTIAQVPDNVDTVVLGGGGFRAIGAIEALEATLDRPVMSANQASFWCALRRSGVNDGVTGYGRLFSMNLSES